VYDKKVQKAMLATGMVFMISQGAGMILMIVVVLYMYFGKK
jgi:hypothetical protein